MDGTAKAAWMAKAALTAGTAVRRRGEEKLVRWRSL